VAYGARLESVCALTRTVGSNPTSSDFYIAKSMYWKNCGPVCRRQGTGETFGHVAITIVSPLMRFELFSLIFFLLQDSQAVPF
jgi:hypothetical protein